MLETLQETIAQGTELRSARLWEEARSVRLWEKARLERQKVVHLALPWVVKKDSPSERRLVE